MSNAAGREASDRPVWVDEVENPYLHGMYAPTVHETTALTLEVPIDAFGKIGAAAEGQAAYGEAASAIYTNCCPAIVVCNI